MKSAEVEKQLSEAQETVQVLQKELAETNRGLVALTMELEQRVDERTAELRAAHEELKNTNSELMRLTLELEERVAQRTAELEIANETLRESESRFRQLANFLPQLVWTCQPDGACDFLSQRWMAYTGTAG